MPRQPLTIAPRYTKPNGFQGTEVAWRVLCDLYPSAETPEVIMAVVEYCAARRLDPLRKPVHVVPMWNAKAGRRVQVVMQGINEIETTAHRTGQWAGMDEPKFGPLDQRTFKGIVEDDNGTKREISVAMTFPEWCSVTVYRLVGGNPRAWSEPVFWIEAYGRAGFRSEVPNARWQLAPRQMLIKCAKSASLRAAFPEERFGYAAEEMEGQELDAGGVTIDGKVDWGDPNLTERDRRIEQPASPPPSGEATDPYPELADQNSGRWFKALQRVLAGAHSLDELAAIEGHASVQRALKGPSLLRRNIEDELARASERLAPRPNLPAADDLPPDWDEPPADDPVEAIIAEVEAMDMIALNALATSASWRARMAELFPPDRERVGVAIAERLKRKR